MVRHTEHTRSNATPHLALLAALLVRSLELLGVHAGRAHGLVLRGRSPCRLCRLCLGLIAALLLLLLVFLSLLALSFLLCLFLLCLLLLGLFLLCLSFLGLFLLCLSFLGLLLGRWGSRRGSRRGVTSRQLLLE